MRARTVVGRLAPQSIKSRHQSWRERRLRRRVARVNVRYRERHPAVVTSGPFTGLRYPDDVLQIPKLLGTYELELHQAVERLIARDPSTIVNIGAGEGYYAVGLARRLPHARVLAFDINQDEQRRCRTLAQLNGVADRIAVAGECSPDTLRRLPVHDVALLMDCEGCELALLRPDDVPVLRDWPILVELHDFIDPEASTAIAERFAATHEVELIDARSRRGMELDELAFLKPAERDLALDEVRPPGMRWAGMWPRDHGSQGPHR